MSLTLDQVSALAYEAAIQAAQSGARRSAGLASVQDSIGTGFRVVIWWNNEQKVSARFDGQMTFGTGEEELFVVGPADTIEQNDSFDMTTGAGYLRVLSANGERWIDGTFGGADSGADFICDGDFTDIGELRFEFRQGLDAPIIIPSGPGPGILYTIRGDSEPPLAVSSRLFGGHYHYKPVSFAGEPFPDDPSPIEFGRYTRERAHSHIGALWAYIDTPSGDQWGLYDQIVSFFRASGVDFAFPLFATPDHRSSRPNSPTSHYPSLTSHSAAVPNPGEAGSFVTRLLQHDTQLENISFWNEYEVYRGGYWDGTAQEMAALMREVRLARDAVRPSVRLLWPDMVNWSNDASQPWANWLELQNASDGGGGKGGDHQDEIGHHIYWTTGDLNTSIDWAVLNFRKAEVTMNSMGVPNMRKHMTEWGFLDNIPVNANTVRTAIIRMFMLCAAFGYQSSQPFSIDRGANWGGLRPSKDATLIGMWNDASDRMTGKEIIYAHVMTDRSIALGFTDGTTWRF